MDHFYLKLCKCLILSSLKVMVEVNFTKVDVVLAYTAKKLATSRIHCPANLLQQSVLWAQERQIVTRLFRHSHWYTLSVTVLLLLELVSGVVFSLCRLYPAFLVLRLPLSTLLTSTTRDWSEPQPHPAARLWFPLSLLPALILTMSSNTFYNKTLKLARASVCVRVLGPHINTTFNRMGLQWR